MRRWLEIIDSQQGLKNQWHRLLIINNLMLDFLLIFGIFYFVI